MIARQLSRLRGRSACFVLAQALVCALGCGRIGYELTPHTDGVAGDASVDSSVPPSAGGAGTGGAGTGAAGGSAGSGGNGSGAGGASGGASGSSGSGGLGPFDAGAGGRLVMDGGAPSPEAAADAATCRVPVATVSDYCAQLPFLPAAPVIDGKLDCGVALVPVTPIGWTGGATPPDATAEYASAWRADGVYFFVRVHDPSLVPAEPSHEVWQGDSVELYVDDDGRYTAPPNYDIPGSRQLVVAAPASATSSAAVGALYAFGSGGVLEKWTSSQFRAYGTGDGYVVEAFVMGQDLALSSLSLVAGAFVGMDLSIGVSYPSSLGPDAGAPGNRLGQYFLSVGGPDAGAVSLPPFDVRAFCRPVLVR
jgi:hypothetical protein